ncbi:CpaF family protein [Micromonospora aurantiaca]|uniref:CpaF family protein n=1 Tax=Micromonospora aurantiaca (nom. illeg.) TaxID=47850 RepID=A0ABQ6UD95_9ACTN|nr:ATPase, T2SS/T4P/T4SS family [Micromonospora aurantiaca]KAB1109121.1 CpaF family protein [Micromonospora aurantiaca]
MTPPPDGVMSEADLVVDVRAQVAQALAGHAGGGPLPAAERRRLAEQYTGEALDAHARQALDAGRAPLSASAEARVARAVLDHVVGAGGLQQLLDNPEIENVHANGADEVFIRYAGGKSEVGPPIAESDEAMIEMVRALATEAAFGDDFSGHGEERTFDRTNPVLDLRLRDGSRLCAIMSVAKRPALSIRRPTMINADLDDLVAKGTLDEPLCRVLQAAMRAKLNIIFAGGTNTGKTTFARAAARAIPPHERLITIEDSYELELHDAVAHPNVTALQARRVNLEGVGAVSMAALVRTALRMDPDRVIVGEARGDEVIDLLKAMSQGNDGSFATVHASSSAQAFTRLMMYAVQAPERLTFEASAMLIAESLHLVVHLNWSPDKTRVVSSVREVVGFDGRDVMSNEVWRPGHGQRAVPNTPLRTETLDRLEAAGLDPRVIDRVGW